MLDPAHTPAGNTDWAGLEQMTEEDVESRAIADPDALPASEAELRAARRLYPAGTEPVLLPIERTVVEWFRAHSGNGDFREEMSRALREYVSERR